MRVDVAASAREDLEGIVTYLAETLGSPRVAESFLDEFESFLDTVGKLPESYPWCLDERLRKRGYRRALVKKYVALYLADGEAVHVIHVFHSSQDYARLV